MYAFEYSIFLPDDITVLIGEFPWRTDLVGVIVENAPCLRGIIVFRRKSKVGTRWLGQCGRFHLQGNSALLAQQSLHKGFSRLTRIPVQVVIVFGVFFIVPVVCLRISFGERHEAGVPFSFIGRPGLFLPLSCSPRGLGVCGEAARQPGVVGGFRGGIRNPLIDAGFREAARQPSVVGGFKGAIRQSSIDVGLRTVICAGIDVGAGIGAIKTQQTQRKQKAKPDDKSAGGFVAFP